jgi:hypothetical protein
MGKEHWKSTNVTCRNNVAVEWFRNCVCNLVSGVVSDVGLMAFEDQGINAREYFVTDYYDPFDVPSYSTAMPVRKKPPPYIPSRAPHESTEFQDQVDSEEQDNGVVSSARSTTSHSTSTFAASEPLLFRHAIEEGYAALEQMASSRGNDTSSLGDFIKSTKRLRDGSEPLDDIALDAPRKHPCKRSRPYCSILPMLSPASTHVVAENTVSKHPRNAWTEEEAKLLLSTRDLGHSWVEIGNVSPTLKL